MHPARLRLVTFDITGTLLKFRHDPVEFYAEIGRVYGVAADVNVMDANFKRSWRELSRDHPNFGVKTGLGWENWWSRLVKGTFRNPASCPAEETLAAISTHLIDSFRTALCWEHCDGAADLLSYLRAEGVRLGVVSNFDPRLDAILRNTELRHYFDFVLTSYEAGAQKPEVEIFGKALRAARVDGLRAGDCLHVGNEVDRDYLGAKNSGFRSCLVNCRERDEVADKYPQVTKGDVFSGLRDVHAHFYNNRSVYFEKSRLHNEK